MEKFSSIINTPIGQLGILTENNKLIALNFLLDKLSDVPPRQAYDRHVVQELKNYFKNANHPFNIEYELNGTPFQKKVWHALTKIPLSEALSYGELAKKLKSSPRAIGNACRANHIAIVIPCHRIVAQSSLGGFAGKTSGTTLDIKKWLLSHEHFLKS